jgi:hypothetical protein
MAFRRSALREIGGFDQRFRCAGDDVDICWRLQDRGMKVGFNPGAVVWHHRRASVRAFLRQQSAYGKAEALLERKWPERYNGTGHVAWRGRLYGTGPRPYLGPARRWRVYYGAQGSAPFQSIHPPGNASMASLALMPESYLVVCGLSTLALLGVAWRPLFFIFGPLLAIALGAVFLHAFRNAAGAELATAPRSRVKGLCMRALIALLHAIQPAARLHGRLAQGLRPWGHRGKMRSRLPGPRTWALWSTRWTDPQARLKAIENRLRAGGARIARGGPYDRWDLEVGVGMLNSTRLQMAVEEHAGGAQLVRIYASPRRPVVAATICAALAALAVLSEVHQARFAAGVLASIFVAILTWLMIGSAKVAGIVADAVEQADDTATSIGRSKRWKPRVR